MKKMFMAAGMAAVMTACGTAGQSIQLLSVFHRST